MQTYSHFLITASLRKAVPALKPVPKSAVYLGAVAPDIPLLCLSLGYSGYYRYVLGWESREVFRFIYGTLFFSDPVWILSHNTLQAPFILIFGLITLWRVHGNTQVFRSWWFWFFAACLLHTGIDILTHHDDGPLVFFPFNWDVRFMSPVSYWDRDHYGVIFSRLEHIADGLLALYLLIPLLWRRIMRWNTRTAG